MRGLRRLRAILVIVPPLAVVAGVSLFSAAQPVPAAGRSSVRVIDGDTLAIGGVRIDLYGIDAPELGQVCLHNGTRWRCGEAAAFALHKIIEVSDQPVRCEAWDAGGAQRGSTCRIGQRDLAHTLLQSGDVLALPESFPEYRESEARAKASGLGLWRGRFVEPWEWRSGRRLPEEADDAPACPVKGVIAAAGAKSILVPTDEGYAGTKIDPALGGKCFESDVAAFADGWGPVLQTLR